MTTVAQAIKAWEAENEGSAEEATEIKLLNKTPPIAKLDTKVMGSLKKCQKLSLSTNMIDRMVNLTGMAELRILSLGRNNIKKIEKLEDVAGTLQELWISCNQISLLDGLACLTNLTIFYCSHNLIKSFSELDKLKSNEQLRDVVFLGNPMYAEVTSKEEARIEILRHLPNLKKIDGVLVKPSEIEASQLAPSE